MSTNEEYDYCSTQRSIIAGQTADMYDIHDGYKIMRRKGNVTQTYKFTLYHFLF